MRMLIGDTPTVLGTMARRLHDATPARSAHEKIASRLWGHIKALEYTSGRLVVAGKDAEVLAGAPPGTPRALGGWIDPETGTKTQDDVLLTADLPPAGEWPHQTLALRSASDDDLDHVDVMIANLPFTDTRILNQDDSELIAEMHGQLVTDALAWLRPGGLLVALVHRQLLETTETGMRRSISRHADLIAAARLPASALRAAPLLDSPVDLLLLRRREPGHPPSGLGFIGRSPVHVQDAPDMLINDCYASAPWAVLGNIVPDPIQPGLTSVAPTGGDFDSALRIALTTHIDHAIDARLYAQQRPPHTQHQRPPGGTPREPGADPGTPAL